MEKQVIGSPTGGATIGTANTTSVLIEEGEFEPRVLEEEVGEQVRCSRFALLVFLCTHHTGLFR